MTTLIIAESFPLGVGGTAIRRGVCGEGAGARWRAEARSMPDIARLDDENHVFSNFHLEGIDRGIAQSGHRDQTLVENLELFGGAA
jgi:hypothetical protein